MIPKIEFIKFYIIRIYKKDKFIGFVKSWRKHRNGKYRFEKTKNIDFAIKTISRHESQRLEIRLSELKDHIYSNSYLFVSEKITEQDIRLSKLIAIRLNSKLGIFKNK
jgi:hypothetical protein